MHPPPLTILHVFSTFDIGGTEVRTCGLINNLGSEFHHSIRVLKPRKSAEKLLKKHVTMYNEAFPSNVFKAISHAAKEIEHLKPDLIVTYSWGAIEWLIANAIFNKRPLIHSEDGFTDETPEKQNPVRLLVRRLFFRRCTRLFVPAQVLQNTALKMWHVPYQRIAFIPNSVDTARFTPASTDNISSNKTIVYLGIIGTLYPVKNHARLLRIFARLPSDMPVKLMIVGTGPSLETLEDLCDELAIKEKVVFSGLRNDPEVVLKSIDIFCLSSDHEQMPLTVLEAMSSGLPVISTDVGDVASMVSDENKPFIIPIGREDLYLSQLKLLILNESIRKSIGEANRAKCCSCYSPDRMYRQFSELYIATAGKY